ncbi:MAG: hypothetical protein R6V83_10125 [Candidatus Thorarchaeota archaeon]
MANLILGGIAAIAAALVASIAIIVGASWLQYERRELQLAGKWPLSCELCEGRPVMMRRINSFQFSSRRNQRDYSCD